MVAGQLACSDWTFMQVSRQQRFFGVESFLLMTLGVTPLIPGLLALVGR